MSIAYQSQPTVEASSTDEEVQDWRQRFESDGVLAMEGLPVVADLEWIAASVVAASAGIAICSRYLSMKRAMDVIGGLLGLCILGPVMLIAMLAVWWKDGGPVVFTQTRVGQGGRHFKLYKIRTMCQDAEHKLESLLAENKHADERTFKMHDDPRVIPRIGHLLRRTSIDEFPQLINVLKGDMSLVGPRPALPREVEKYCQDDMIRLTVKPGLTCIWQVSGRGNLCFKQQIDLDRTYVQQCSLLLDAKLIVQTVPALLAGKGAH